MRGVKKYIVKIVWNIVLNSHLKDIKMLDFNEVTLTKNKLEIRRIVDRNKRAIPDSWDGLFFGIGGKMLRSRHVRDTAFLWNLKSFSSFHSPLLFFLSASVASLLWLALKKTAWVVVWSLNTILFAWFVWKKIQKEKAAGVAEILFSLFFLHPCGFPLYKWPYTSYLHFYLLNPTTQWFGLFFQNTTRKTVYFLFKLNWNYQFDRRVSTNVYSSLSFVYSRKTHKARKALILKDYKCNC